MGIVFKDPSNTNYDSMIMKKKKTTLVKLTKSKQQQKASKTNKKQNAAWNYLSCCSSKLQI